MDRILKAYLKRLTNLSSRNKSLLLAHLAAEQFFDIHEADFLLNKPSSEIVRQLIQLKNRIPLLDVADPRFEKVNLASKRLRKISRTEQFIREERGSQDLYVGYPFIKGKLADGTTIHAPLLFFPVTLKMDREQWCLFPREEGSPVLNQSFALAYAHFNETQVSDEILEKTFEDFPKDFREFHTQLYEWLKSTPFRINFNQALFDEKLISFSAEKNSVLEETERAGELKLQPEAVLGIFPQAGSYLVPDYQKLLQDNAGQPLAIPLLSTSPDELHAAADYAAPRAREEDLLTPFPIDEAQEAIILHVKSGKSVVVQGPPGSGKSQLICNLMADFSSRGKRVLLVCQKRAALDVVYQRLSTIGMNDFVALIHDFKNDRAELYRQIASQIEKVGEYRSQNYSLDAVFLERQFAQESRVIDKTVAELQDFRTALFDDNECGMSVKELYLTSNPQETGMQLGNLYRNFRFDTLDPFKRKLATYSKYAAYISGTHPWSQRRSFARFGMNELRSIENMLADWPVAFAKLKSQFEKLSDQTFSKSFIQNRQETHERLSDILQLVSSETSWHLYRQYLENEQEAPERLAFVRQAREALSGYIAEDGIEFSLPASELQVFLISLKKAIAAKETAVSGFFWGIFGKEKKDIEKVANVNGLSLSLEDLQKLSIKIRNRQDLENWLNKPLLHYHATFINQNNPEAGFSAFFEAAENAADAVVRSTFQPWIVVLKALCGSNKLVSDFSAKVSGLLKWLDSWNRAYQQMLPFLLPAQIEKLIDSAEKTAGGLQKSLSADFDSIVDMDRIFEDMSETERQATRLAQQAAGDEIINAVSLFENSLKLAWIAHIETKYPALRSVTSLKMSEWEADLQNGILRKQQLSADINGIQLRERTYEDIEKNRLGNTVTYRELSHQVTKKRRIWPIRKLLENYSEDVFALVPCWMASPEAVSAIFPMQEGIFDLVIFDEASQCYAEFGLPAAFRGKQVVVTGDSKQLPPSDLYRIRYEERPDEEEYTAALEIESLLDLAAQSLPQYQLTGHYRSKSLDLIDFSNRHFYKSSLKLLPDFHEINDNQPGIQYIKTEGVWQKNTNLAEVEAVVKLVKQLIPAGTSLGIVTFNFFQQAAIVEALEKENLILPDLFVKNIENVQGDERDVIIFSMGYAPDEQGRLSMQFGSLSMQGGENRLNVAITRARERVYFVTSIWPAQLQTEQSANAGPKLLRAYLEYALEVSEGRFTAQPKGLVQFRSDWFLKEKLVSQNKEYVRELPFGDVTVKKEGVYKGLILTDDDLYHESKTSKEPHAYLPLLLQTKNWPYRRLFSRDYWSGNLDQKLL